jgi:hypothetical protein
MVDNVFSEGVIFIPGIRKGNVFPTAVIKRRIGSGKAITNKYLPATIKIILYSLTL